MEEVQQPRGQQARGGESEKWVDKGSDKEEDQRIKGLSRKSHFNGGRAVHHPNRPSRQSMIRIFKQNSSLDLDHLKHFWTAEIVLDRVQHRPRIPFFK